MRWLVTEKNANFGIRRTEGGLQYKHIVDFGKTWSLQWQYIDKYIQKDAKNKIQKMPDNALNTQSSNETTFRIRLEDYPNETRDSMLNKDFAIGYDGKEYSFWSISGETIDHSSQMIKYSAIRDWLFEVGINNLFKEKNECVMKRGMVDNIIYGPKGEQLWNIAPDSENWFGEDTDNLNDNNFQPPFSIQSIVHKCDAVGPDNNSNDILYKDWVLVFVQCGQEAAVFPGAENTTYANREYIYTDSGIPQGYSVFALPYNGDNFRFIDFNNKVLPIKMGDFETMAVFDRLLSSPYVYKIVPLTSSIIPWDSRFTIWNQDSKTWDIKIPRVLPKYSLNFFSNMIDRGTEFERGDVYWLRIQNTKKWKDNIATFELPDLRKADRYFTNITSPYESYNHAKLHAEPYYKIELRNSDNQWMKLFPQLFIPTDKEITSWRTGLLNEIHLSVDAGITSILRPYLYGISGDYTLQQGVYFNNTSSFTYNLITDPYKQYLSRNRDQLNEKFRYNRQKDDDLSRMTDIRHKENSAIGGINIAQGAVQAIPGIMDIFSGGAGKALNAGFNVARDATQMAFNTKKIEASASQERHALVNEINQTKATLSDLKGSPNSIKGSGGLIGLWQSNNELFPTLLQSRLWPSLEKAIGDMFQRYGSNLSSINKNINEYLASRFYFNYIECDSNYENYREEMQLSQNVKNIIDTSLKNGLTIWHYRYDEMWNGIKEYNVNNVETKYATGIPEGIDWKLDHEVY